MAAEHSAATAARQTDRPGTGTQRLELSSVSISFGGIRALREVSLTVEAGTICGLIGPNGAGKTTLFNCVTGVYQPDSGQIRWDGVELTALPRRQIIKHRVARTFQNVALFPELDVIENVMLGAHHRDRAGVAAAALRLPRFRRQERDLRQQAAEILGSLGLERFAAASPEDLTLGTAKRVELARALMSEPKLLLLDEPASGLVHSEVRELGEVIRTLRERYDLTVVLVEHHMELVMSLADHVAVLASGQRLAYGPPAAVQNDPAVIAAYLGSAE
ncbi:ABC transporter ATP-binding protein [Micromonospora sonneratiae]|uniref:ABC transporter ATP-binding protein n=1 Tax=Micromonospora sonneratiae TaxID=1184706 RepID=A0ABW3YAG1_9ACTN